MKEKTYVRLCYLFNVRNFRTINQNTLFRGGQYVEDNSHIVFLLLKVRICKQYNFYAFACV
jgi:hypothetical protein